MGKGKNQMPRWERARIRCYGRGAPSLRFPAVPPWGALPVSGAKPRQMQAPCPGATSSGMLLRWPRQLRSWQRRPEEAAGARGLCGGLAVAGGGRDVCVRGDGAGQRAGGGGADTPRGGRGSGGQRQGCAQAVTVFATETCFAFAHFCTFPRRVRRSRSRRRWRGRARRARRVPAPGSTAGRGPNKLPGSNTLGVAIAELDPRRRAHSLHQATTLHLCWQREAGRARGRGAGWGLSHG